MAQEIIHGPIDCACVIHGTAYSWDYVERLHNMLSRHITLGIRLHVYTEADRPVPAPMIKHVLEPWSIASAKNLGGTKCNFLTLLIMQGHYCTLI